MDTETIAQLTDINDSREAFYLTAQEVTESNPSFSKSLEEDRLNWASLGMNDESEVSNNLSIHTDLPSYLMHDEFELRSYLGVPVISAKSASVFDRVGGNSEVTLGFFRNVTNMETGDTLPIIFLNGELIKATYGSSIIPSLHEYIDSIIKHEYSHYNWAKYAKLNKLEIDTSELSSQVSLSLDDENIVLPVDRLRNYIDRSAMNEIYALITEPILELNTSRRLMASTRGMQNALLNPYAPDSYRYLQNFLGKDRTKKILASDKKTDDLIKLEEDYSIGVKELQNLLQQTYSLSLIAGQWSQMWSSEKVIQTIGGILLTSKNITEVNNQIRSLFLSPSKQTNDKLFEFLSKAPASEKQKIVRVLEQVPPLEWEVELAS